MKRPTRPTAIALSLFVIALFALSVPTGVHAKSDPADTGWLDGLSLVELDTDDMGSLHRAIGLIQSYGGRVGVVSPPSLLLGWIPYEVRDELIGQGGIRDIYVSEVLPGEVAARDAQSRYTVSFFNRVARGEYQEGLHRRMETAPAQWPDTHRPDGLLRDEPLDKEAYIQNLTDNGFDIQQLQDRGIQLYGSNSEKMTGTSTVTVIFVESDGTGADPNLYTWTSQHVQDYLDGVSAGLLWWSDQANNYAGCWAAFFIRYFPPTDSRCQQWREMVLHSSGDVASMASEIMGNFGYTGGGALARTDAFNTAQRATYGTDWAYTAYVAYNPPPASDQLTDGFSAFAYLGGSYTFLLYKSYSWDPNQVFTHETGHIYGACDEYLDSGCSCANFCSNGVVNGNCAACGGVACMMKNNSFAVCSYTDDHLGWQTSPCAPAPLTPPTANTIYPASGLQGTSVDVTIAGSDFLYGVYATFGPGVTVSSSSAVGSDTLHLTLTIDNDATASVRDVVVSNRDLQASVLTNAFEVVQTTRHYMSPSGGNVFPYISASDAATSLANAITAAGDGDTLFVESTTIANSVIVNEAVYLMGGWNSSFTSRDLVSGKTVIHPLTNVSFVSTTGGGLDGFLVEGGSGAGDNIPVGGVYGGAVRVSLSTATLRNCEFRNCDAGSGGGVSAVNSVLTLDNCNIHDNTSLLGGGVYLYNSSATITDNTIVDNDVTQVTGTREGGGIYAQNCTGIVMSGNTIDGNLGAQSGGGVLLRNSTGVTINGGSISHHSTTSGGAGVHVDGSQVVLDGVVLDRNVGNLGGAVVATNTADVTLAHCRVSWNAGIVGAGVYATGGTLDLSHNLFVGNSATGGPGGGILATGITAGAIVGNTMDRNTAVTGAGALLISNSAPLDTIYNNIVTNTTGIGVQCAGTPPVLAYNDVWNSTGAAYDGCSAGVGSISADPVFADTAAYDYHLGVHSPAIDTGNPSYDDPDGSPGDMGRYGAHSFTMDQPSYVKNLIASVESGNAILRWSTNPEGDVAQYAVYCDTASGFAPGAGNFVTFVAAPDTSADLGAPTDTAYYRVAAIDADGYEGGYSGEATIGPATGVAGVTAWANRLFQNVPNPFNPSTTIRFELAVPADVTLIVYDVAGRVVKRLVDGRTGAGVHDAVWDGTNAAGQRVSSGVYFYRLTTDRFSKTRKMVMLK